MKDKILPIVTAVIVIIAICVIIFVPKNKNEKNENVSVTNSSTTAITNTTKQVEEVDTKLNDDEDLEINLEDLDISNPTFINYVSNGVNIELVAIKDEENNIDIAFNTCQVCNGSPKAYFVQKNEKLICQNCGNAFSFSSIGASANGCNPITIDDTNVTKTETGITISKEFLSQNEKLFTNVAKH